MSNKSIENKNNFLSFYQYESMKAFQKLKNLKSLKNSFIFHRSGDIKYSSSKYKTANSFTFSRSILSEVERIGSNNKNQRLNLLNIPPQRGWNEKHALESETLVPNITMLKPSFPSFSRSILNKNSKYSFNSNQNIVCDMVTPTELNYNRADNTIVEITYKKENIKKEEQNTNSYSNINSPITIKNGVEVTDSHEEKIENLINTVEQRVIQRVSSDVMAKVEAKWSREIMRRGGDYGR
ncbi:hypothetical protein GSY74_08735 [Sulfurovum sp. bin170]|nr:hypothetical protein [Sulfurovum sp. bin170]